MSMLSIRVPFSEQTWVIFRERQGGVLPLDRLTSPLFLLERLCEIMEVLFAAHFTSQRSFP
jgi:hypothetical protein